MVQRNFSKQPSYGLFDLHIHVLPGLDDGAGSLMEAVAMLEWAAQSGVRTMVATPHANQRGRFENYLSPQMSRSMEQLQREIHRRGIPIQLLAGMEIYASEDLVERIQQGQLCSMAGSAYYMVEFSPLCPREDVEMLLRQMLRHGFLPLIAHPERYQCVQRNPEVVRIWRGLGCAVQLETGSLLGQFGQNAHRAARWMLDRGQVDVFGSDAHGQKRKTPSMQELWQYLEREVGTPKAKQLLVEQPHRLLSTLPK